MDERTVPEANPLVARREKLAALEACGVDPYPARWKVTDTAAELIAAYRDGGPAVRGRVAGRIVSFRSHGKTTFLHIADRSGRIQVYLRQDDLADAYQILEHLDLGDFAGVAGELFRTKTGEVSIRAHEIAVLAKSLRPLPLGKEAEGRTWHRVVDPEFRYRQRYADLAIRPEMRDVFVKRARITRYLRNFLDERGFLEVETPVLQPVYGGAAARPFTTYHNTLDTTLYLRIADELYLKRCVVGGLDRVYEISKDFRNEGMDRFHNPEFTMLEFYQAYADYEEFMVLAEELLAGVVRELTGASSITYQGTTVDTAPPWPRLRFLDALAERGVEVGDLSREQLLLQAQRLGVEVDPSSSAGKVLDDLFGALVEPRLDGPLFVTDHPAALSPLAKRRTDDARLVERFEAYLFGKEWGNAFSELNDPREQRARFEEQAAAAAAGDLEAPATMDEDFLRALEYGMPPTAGMGIGVDRLVMFLTDQPSIRDVILFPSLREETSDEMRGLEETAGTP